MKEFDREDLFSLMDGDEPEGFDLIEDEIVSTSRWTKTNRIVFKHNNKFYAVKYQTGATEYQDVGDMFGVSHADLVPCHEVFPVIKTITVYEEQ